MLVSASLAPQSENKLFFPSILDIIHTAQPMENKAF